MRGKKAKFLRKLAALNPDLPKVAYADYSPREYQNIGSESMPYFVMIKRGVPRVMDLCIRAIYKKLKKGG